MLKALLAKIGSIGMVDGQLVNKLRTDIVNFGLVSGEAPLIEQIAIGCEDPEALISNLKLLGLTEWHRDTVEAIGTVFSKQGSNVASLNFNYQLGFELELLHYESGDNWHEVRYEDGPFLSHIGIHVNSLQLEEYKAKFRVAGIKIAQEVETISHTNPAIAGKRKYKYVVFDTKELFGFDFKLILRKDIADTEPDH